MACLYVASARLPAMSDLRNQVVGGERAVGPLGVLKFGISKYDDPDRRMAVHRASPYSPFHVPIKNLAAVCCKTFQTVREARDEEWLLRCFVKERLPHNRPGLWDGGLSVIYYGRGPASSGEWFYDGPTGAPSGEWLFHSCCDACAEAEFFSVVKELPSVRLPEFQKRVCFKRQRHPARARVVLEIEARKLRAQSWTRARRAGVADDFAQAEIRRDMAMLSGSGPDVFAVWMLANSDRSRGCLPPSQTSLHPRFVAGMIGMPEERAVAAVEYLCRVPRLRHLHAYVYEVLPYLGAP